MEQGRGKLDLYVLFPSTEKGGFSPVHRNGSLYYTAYLSAY